MPLTETTKIIENGIVATGDVHNRIGPFAILIRNDRIIDLAPRSEPLKNQFPGAEVIDAGGKLLLPGFVDAHYHGESFLLRHITGTVPLAKWDKDRRIDAARGFLTRSASREDLDSLYRLAYFNALKAGVTCIADFGMDNLDLSLSAGFEAMKRADLKGFIGLHNGDQVEKSRTLQSHSIRFAAVIPGEDDLTTYNLQSALRSATDLKTGLMVQLGETRCAFETLKRNFHRTTIQLLNEYRLFDMKIQLSHCSLLEGDDAEVLAVTRIPIVISPHAAILKEVDLPPVDEFMARGIPIALGTDWGSPEPFLNIQSLVAIVRGQNRPIPGPFELLAMCTRNPARALGFQDEIGTIEPGKKADLTFVDLSDSRRGIMPGSGFSTNLLNAVLLESSSRDVSDVMINGNFFVRNGTVLTYSEEDLLAEGNRLMGKILGQITQKEPAIPAETTSQAAPILRLDVPVEEEEVRGQSEEGFRIVRKNRNEAEPQKVTAPERAEPVKSTEPPRSIRKVFGEDDV